MNKKFGALKEAESKGWQEERKPPPRQRKVVKKPASALVAKPVGGAAAKSRLAAIKAAIKVKQLAAEAEKAVQAAGPGSAVDDPAQAPQDPQAETLAPESPVVVFQGGFFQVESPAKLTGESHTSAVLYPRFPSTAVMHRDMDGGRGRCIEWQAERTEGLLGPGRPLTSPSVSVRGTN